MMTRFYGTVNDIMRVVLGASGTFSIINSKTGKHYPSGSDQQIATFTKYLALQYLTEECCEGIMNR
jgi:hypothetical protein